MIGQRPERLVVITGTGTEIGKTWVGAALCGELRSAGWRVAARKPAQSFDPSDGAPTDAERLAGATGEDPGVICPAYRWYRVPLAPPMAAAALGLASFTIAELADEVERSWPMPAAHIGLVEGAGGVAAPQADDGDMVALIRALGPDVVVVVADAGLGSINLVRLSMAALGPHRVVVHLNRFDKTLDLHDRNRAWLVERDGFEVTTSIGGLASVLLNP